MTPDLFCEDVHDPGGKTRTSLAAGVHGDAIFAGTNGQYRPLLRRWIGDIFPAKYAAFVGMNPSTASGVVNDSTITREFSFSRQWGYAGFVKVNVSDYRATYPKDLLALGANELRSSEYWQHVDPVLRNADLVVACWGSVNKALQPLAVQMRERLLALDKVRPVMCFGLNRDGNPKHPLYLRTDSVLMPLSPPHQVWH